jgi:hypothetical protein
MANFKKEKKSPFDSLDSDYKDAVAAMTPGEINSRIAEVAQNEYENKRSQKEDKDLAEKKDTVKKLSAPYDQKSKENGLRISASIQVLKDERVLVGTRDDLNKLISDTAKGEEENQMAKDEDQELTSAKELAKEAGEQYKEASKQNRLRIQYALRVLSDKGSA